MKAVKLVSIVVFFTIVFAVLLFISRNQPGDFGAVSRDNLPDAQSPSYQSQTDEQGQATVEVTPVELSKDAPVWKFNVVMDTHSVELDADMAKASVLVDEAGLKYPALSWEGAEAGGHHREGTLSFAPIYPTPKSVEVLIQNVGDAANRSFKWQLNNQRN